MASKQSAVVANEERDKLFLSHSLKIGDSQNIRLISISADADCEGKIAVDMQAVSVNNAPPYTALSYVWGSPESTRTITAGGHTIIVRQNLWNFLKQARRAGEDGLFWIDALCIDQSSIRERKHQVSVMGQIYSRANKVIAWFGVGPPELVDAVRGLRAAHLHMWPCNGQDLHIVRKLMPTFCEAEY